MLVTIRPKCPAPIPAVARVYGKQAVELISLVSPSSRRGSPVVGLPNVFVSDKYYPYYQTRNVAHGTTYHCVSLLSVIVCKVDRWARRSCPQERILMGYYLCSGPRPSIRYVLVDYSTTFAVM